MDRADQAADTKTPAESSELSPIERKIEAFFADFPLRHYDKGQILIFPDENPQYIFFLRSGLVRQYDVSYRGDEIVVNVFKPNTFFPMSWPVAELPNDYFFQAAEPLDVYLGDPQKVLQFLKDNPDVLLDLLRRVYLGTKGMQRRMVHLMSGTAKSRLMFELLLECRRFGTMLEDGSCRINMSESELGARAGLSRETVSREMHKLTKSKLAAIKKGVITVYDLDHFGENLGRVI